MERRRHLRKPIRLAVTYRSAEALITEFTTCVSRGGCAFVVQRPLELGTLFVFEMVLQGHGAPLEIEGRVARVQPLEGTAPRFEIGIEYLTVGPQRELLDALLATIMVDSTYETVRQYPRIPVNLIAHGRGSAARYLIRDLSLGGMRVETKTVANEAVVGSQVVLAARLSDMSQPLAIPGSLVWMHRGSLVIRTRFGVQFTSLTRRQHMVLEGLSRLLRPHSLEIALPSEPVLEREPTYREPRTAAETRELLVELAVKFLSEQPYLALSATHEPSDVRTGMDFVCVGLVGDVDAEISLRVAPTVGAHIAAQTLGDDAASSDHAQVLDAITEWLTTLAGFACDQLDELGVELVVTAPIPGEPKLGEHVPAVGLDGPYGSVLVSVVTREVVVSDWPI